MPTEAAHPFRRTRRILRNTRGHCRRCALHAQSSVLGWGGICSGAALGMLVYYLLGLVCARLRTAAVVDPAIRGPRAAARHGRAELVRVLRGSRRFRPIGASYPRVARGRGRLGAGGAAWRVARGRAVDDLGERGERGARTVDPSRAPIDRRQRQPHSRLARRHRQIARALDRRRRALAHRLGVRHRQVATNRRDVLRDPAAAAGAQGICHQSAAVDLGIRAAIARRFDQWRALRAASGTRRFSPTGTRRIGAARPRPVKFRCRSAMRPF